MSSMQFKTKSVAFVINASCCFLRCSHTERNPETGKCGLIKLIEPSIAENITVFNLYCLALLKGTVARDCRPQVFFINRPQMGL